MERKKLELIAESLKATINNTASIKWMLADDPDSELCSDAFDLVTSAKDKLNDALEILRKKQ